MKGKLNLMLVILLVVTFSLSASAVTYERLVPIDNFMGLDFNTIIEQGEELGWDNYYVEARAEQYGIWNINDGPIAEISAVLYIPQMFLIQKIANAGVNMEEITPGGFEEYKTNYEEARKQNKIEIAFQLFLKDGEKENVITENVKLFYEDKLNGRTKIDSKDIYSEGFKKQESFLTYYENELNVFINPGKDIDSLNEIKLYILVGDIIGRVDIVWKVKKEKVKTPSI